MSACIDIIKSVKRKYPNQFDSFNSKLKCMVCDQIINLDSKHGSDTVNKHVKSAAHQRKLTKNGKQSFIEKAFQRSKDTTEGKTLFYEDMVEAMISANIPLAKLKNSKFKIFLGKYMNRNIPDDSTLHKGKILDTLYHKSIDSIKNRIENYAIYFICDETQDIKNRYIFNILVGVFNGAYSKPMLLCTKILEKTNSTTVSREILEALNLLYSNENEKYDRLLLIVSDQAPYMIKAISSLKPLVTNLHHITCLAHALNRVCEKIRSENPELNSFISKFKKIIVKSPNRQTKFREETGLKLPPEPVITRWGTWLNAALYYAENYEKIKKFVLKLNEDSQVRNGSKF